MELEQLLHEKIIISRIANGFLFEYNGKQFYASRVIEFIRENLGDLSGYDAEENLGDLSGYDAEENFDYFKDSDATYTLDIIVTKEGKK